MTKSSRTQTSLLEVEGTLGGSPDAACPRGRGGAEPAPEPCLVTATERGARLRQRPVSIWMTGLSGVGKSTIARLLERRVLDADPLHQELTRDPGFSPEDRTENIRRVAEVARLLNDAGLIVIAALISPHRSHRANARTIIGEEGFLEVFVDSPLAVCEGRDPKRLYQKARAGTLPDFTAVSAPYESPESPQVHLRTDGQSAEECVGGILRRLRGIQLDPLHATAGEA